MLKIDYKNKVFSCFNTSPLSNQMTSSPSMCAVDEKFIYATGGAGTDGINVATCHMYDIGRNQWA